MRKSLKRVLNVMSAFAIITGVAMPVNMVSAEEASSVVSYDSATSTNMKLLNSSEENKAELDKAWSLVTPVMEIINAMRANPENYQTVATDTGFNILPVDATDSTAPLLCVSTFRFDTCVKTDVIIREPDSSSIICCDKTAYTAMFGDVLTGELFQSDTTFTTFVKEIKESVDDENITINLFASELPEVSGGLSGITYNWWINSGYLGLENIVSPESPVAVVKSVTDQPATYDVNVISDNISLKDIKKLRYLNSLEVNYDLLTEANNSMQPIYATLDKIFGEGYTMVDNGDSLFYAPEGTEEITRENAVLTIDFVLFGTGSAVAVIRDTETGAVSIFNQNSYNGLLKASLPEPETLTRWLGEISDSFIGEGEKTDPVVINFIGTEFQELNLGTDRPVIINWWNDSEFLNVHNHMPDTIPIFLYKSQNANDYTVNLITEANRKIICVPVSNGDAVKYGDINLDDEIDIRDVTTLNQYLIKVFELNDQQLANADVVYDSVVDISDLGQLKKYILNLISIDNLGLKS